MRRASGGSNSPKEATPPRLSRAPSPGYDGLVEPGLFLPATGKSKSAPNVTSSNTTAATLGEAEVDDVCMARVLGHLRSIEQQVSQSILSQQQHLHSLRSDFHRALLALPDELAFRLSKESSSERELGSPPQCAMPTWQQHQASAADTRLISRSASSDAPGASSQSNPVGSGSSTTVQFVLPTTDVEASWQSSTRRDSLTTPGGAGMALPRYSNSRDFAFAFEPRSGCDDRATGIESGQSKTLSLKGLKHADSTSPAASRRLGDRSAAERTPLKLSQWKWSPWDACQLQRYLPSLPLRQESWTRLTLDIMSVIFLLYDAVSVPYLIAWHGGPSKLLLVMRLSGTSFWLLDFFFSFVSCKTNQYGIVVNTFPTIAQHYFRTWFAPDLALLVMDLIDLFLELTMPDRKGASAAVKLLRLLKAGRLMRIMFILSSGRFGHFGEKLLQSAQRIGAEAHLLFLLRISKIFLLVLWVNHIGGCLFYIIVRHGGEWSDTGRGWRAQISNDLDVVDYSSEYVQESFLYASSLYWSMSTMASGASIFMPTNSVEAFFGLTYIMFGILVAGSLISSLSAMLVEFNMRNGGNSEVMRRVQSFLRQYHVDAGLATGIIYQITQRMAERPAITVQDVPALSMLSVELRERLWANLYTPLLSQHTFLRCLDYLDDLFMRDLASSAVSSRTYQPGEAVLSVGEKVDSAFVGTARGFSLYSLARKGDYFRRVESMVVDEGMWLCEVTLWLQWESLGRAEASRTTEMILVSQKPLWRLMDFRPEIRSIATDFARTFAAAVRRERPPLTDLGLLIDYHTVVSLMSADSCLALSRPALNAVRTKRLMDHTGIWHGFEQEIVNGDCELGTDAHGLIVRIVRLVSLHLSLPDGRICVKLGTSEGRAFKADAKLPGLQVEPGEYPLDAVQRFFSVDFPSLLDEIVWIDRTVEMEMESSKACPLTTKYVRTTLVAKVTEEQRASLQDCLVLDPEGNYSSLEFAGADFFAVSEGTSIYAWMPPQTWENLEKRKDKDIVVQGHIAAMVASPPSPAACVLDI
mmetsp:Transcript_67522/g.162069  ORF Transcript_67522/g.162069 Transcript_67522/m.162069 type:complete len:1036 (+) Transcript_67522:85-3192(+)